MKQYLLLVTLAAGILGGTPFAWSAPEALDRVLYGQDALAYSSGVIIQNLPLDGTVNRITGDNQTTGNRRLLAKGDTFYLTVEHPEETSPGDYFTVYQQVQEIRHPRDAGFIGNLFTMSGLLEVVESGANPVTVKVLTSYGAMYPGDSVMRFVAPSEPDPAARPAEGAEGTIVHLTPNRTLIAQRHVVYIDWGSQDGIIRGDRLEVFRDTEGLPRRVIGELTVLRVGEKASSALVTQSKYHYLRGDQFVLKGSVPRPNAQAAVGPVQASLGPEGSDQASRDSAQASRSVDGLEDGKLTVGGLVDQLHFDTGRIVIRPKGMRMLEQVTELLKKADDNQIRVEGHTDDVEIGPTLKKTYPTNWELSQARAAEVVRYLVEKGGLDRATLSSVGHADTQPVATNATDAGRQKNRRVEILFSSFDPSANGQDMAGEAAGEPEAEEASAESDAEAGTIDEAAAETERSEGEGSEAVTEEGSEATEPDGMSWMQEMVDLLDREMQELGELLDGEASKAVVEEAPVTPEPMQAHAAVEPEVEGPDALDEVDLEVDPLDGEDLTEEASVTPEPQKPRSTARLKDTRSFRELEEVGLLPPASDILPDVSLFTN